MKWGLLKQAQIKPFTTTKNHYRKCVRILCTEEKTRQPQSWEHSMDKADLIKNSASQTLFSQSNNGEKERINRNITNQKNHQ